MLAIVELLLLRNRATTANLRPRPADSPVINANPTQHEDRALEINRQTSLAVIDHPQHAVISLRLLAAAAPMPAQLFGGLRCHWCIPHRPGSRLRVEVVTADIRAVAMAVVTSCALNEHDYSVELAFLDSEQAFQIRMIEQLCCIQHYQALIQRRDGRRLDGNQAAQEWISRYAEDFPTA